MYYILKCIIVSFLEVSLKIHFAQKSEGAVYIFIFYMVTFESPKWQLTVSHIWFQCALFITQRNNSSELHSHEMMSNP